MKKDKADRIIRESEEERRIIDLCQQGDRPAFELLYQRYARDVYTIALRTVGSEEIAEEVTQEVFISVYKDIRRFQFQSAFTTWLYRIVLRRVADYFRKNKKHREKAVSLSQNAVEEPIPEIKDGGPTPLEAALEVERERMVEEAIRSLSAKQQMILVLRYINNLSYEEISEILKCRLGTVKSRLNRAHKTLEQELKVLDIL